MDKLVWGKQEYTVRNIFFKEQLAAIGRQKVAKKNHETTHCCINGSWKEWRQTFISLHCKGPSATPYHRYNKIQRKDILQIPRFWEENNSPAFLISCILVLIIVFSNLNSCCSKNWNKSVSDCYHYKILSIKCSHEYKTILYNWLNLSSQYPYKAGYRLTLSSFY